jgi:hypothetical protein
MDFSIPFNKAWGVYQKAFIDITVGYLLMLIVSILSLGLLFPGVYYGYNLLILKALRGKPITPTDVFDGMRQYWNLSILLIYAGIIVLLLGITIIGIIPAMLIATWWMYAGLFVVDKNYSITKSMLASKNIVRKNNVWLHLVFLIILAVIGNAGFSLAFIGGLVTMPFSMVVLCAAYEQEAKPDKKH